MIQLCYSYRYIICDTIPVEDEGRARILLLFSKSAL